MLSSAFKKICGHLSTIQKAMPLNLGVLGLAVVPFANEAQAQQTRNTYQSIPVFSSNRTQPSIMFALGTDHQLFLKAYTDFQVEDPNNPGVLKPYDQAYIWSQTYDGYFDPMFCYTYNDADQVFRPSTSQLLVDDSPVGQGSCAAADWSGNFLNWVSMTRMDIVRAAFYGGKRVVDTATSGAQSGVTVLERAYLPNDAHSFAKYLSFTDAEMQRYANLTVAGGAGLIGHQSEFCENSPNDPLCQGFTFCNTTVHPKNNPILSVSLPTSAYPPKLRVVRGNFGFWSASERFQCLFGDPAGDAPRLGPNGVETDIIPRFRSDDLTDQEEEIFGDYLEDANITNNNFNSYLSFLQQVNESSEIQYFVSSLGIGASGTLPPSTQVRAHVRSPTRNTDAYRQDMVVRVQVCDADTYTSGSPKRCKSYTTPDGVETVKPVGVLQENGETETVRFGLITGGFDNNLDAGVLRKNARSISDEINPFTGVVVRNLPEMIINSLDSYRITTYQFSPNNLVNAVPKGLYVACNRNNPSPSNCRDWGNPFGELLLQSYKYFANETDPRTTAETPTSTPAGMTIAVWNDPLDDGNNFLSCANMQVIGVNFSATSDDADLGDAAKPQNARSLNGQNLVSMVPELDRVQSSSINLFTDLFAVGNSSSANNNQGTPGVCDIKSVSSFGDITGVCPLGPGLESTYLTSALGLYAGNNDVRTDPRVDNKSVGLWGIQLNDAAPKITFDLGNDPDDNIPAIEVIPACRGITFIDPTPGPNSTNDTYEQLPTNSCALVDFKLLTTEPGEKDVYFMTWEDSERGNDFDSDINGLLTIERESAGSNQISITSTIFGQSTGSAMDLGYVVLGTNEDGYKTGSRLRGVRADGDPQGCWNGTGTTVTPLPCEQSNTFTPTGPTIQTLEEPLFYAAKWANADIANLSDDEIVDLARAGPGDIEQYVEVEEISDFEQALDDASEGALSGGRSGAIAGPIVNSVGGDGFALQSLYFPRLERVTNNVVETVSWTGLLNGFYSDEFNNFRQDSSDDTGADAGILDANDPIVEFVTVGDEVRFITYDFSPDPTVREASRTAAMAVNSPLYQLNPKWSADRILADLSNPIDQTNFAGHTPGTTRFIVTSLDRDVRVLNEAEVNNADPEGSVEPIELIANYTLTPFTAVEDNGNPTPALIDYLNVSGTGFDGTAEENATKLINYIRGEEQDGLRSRTYDWDQDGTSEVRRLGDIVNSTPRLVSRPAADFGIRYGDTDYDRFRELYRDRRQVVYVGANDGMLHAFNAGFVDSEGRYVRNLEGTDAETGYINLNGAVDAHVLGSELWAYIPHNLLPHLKWLADEDYGDGHVAYVDSTVQVFDVNIFSDTDPAHPGGWGTILVVGMRLGGGEYALPDGTTFYPSYAVFDITNPDGGIDGVDGSDGAPKLLAEFTVSDMGHTFGEVDVAPFRSIDENGFGVTRNDWYLILGSGPTGQDGRTLGVSTQPPNLYSVNLNDLVGTAATAPNLNIQPVTAGFVANGFIPGVEVADWNNDFQADAFYYGVLGDDLPVSLAANFATNNRGALMQAELRPNINDQIIRSPDVLLSNVNAPFATAPHTTRDIVGNAWVFAGSGRYIANVDVSRRSEQNAFYAVRLNTSDYPNNLFDSVALEELFPAHEAVLFFDEGTFDVETRYDSVRIRQASDTSRGVVIEAASTDEEIGFFRPLREVMTTDPDVRGWYRNLDADQRAPTPAAFLGNSLSYNAFTPALSTSCSSEGVFSTEVLDAVTGLPQPQLAFLASSGAGVASEDGTQLSRATTTVATGEGFASTPAFVNSMLISNLSTGETAASNATLILDSFLRRSWRELPVEYIE